MIYGNFIVNILPIIQEIFDVTTIETKVLSIKLLLLVSAIFEPYNMADGPVGDGALIYHRREFLKLQSIFL